MLCLDRKFKPLKTTVCVITLFGNLFFFCLLNVCYLLISGRLSRPMSQRGLPQSFFNPSQTDQFQRLQGTFSHSGKPIHVFQQNNNTITHYNKSCHSTGHHGNYDQNEPHFVQRRDIPVSYAQLPTGVVKGFSPAHVPRISAEPCCAPAASFPQQTAMQNHDLPPSSLRFNPRYNSLLVQPDVKPHLPVVPGEPTRTKRERGKDLEEFPDELLTRKGEH